MASHNFQPPADAPPGAPRRGEFLLQLIQQGSNPDNRSGGGSSGSASDDRTGGWSSGSAHSSGSFSRGSSLDAGASFGSISSVDPADAALPFLDPAVAALGPSHPLSANPMEAMRNHHQQHHQYRAEWSLPLSPTFGPAFNPSVRHHDAPVVDRGLPSPLDPLFCPAGNQPFRGINDTVPHPYTQFRCPVYGDHTLYSRPPPPPSYTHPGFMGQDMPWSLQAQGIAPADNPFTEKERMSVQNAMQLPSLRSVRTQSLEQSKKNGLNVSSANVSHHEKFHLGGEEFLNSSISLPSKGSVVKHGPIGPLKRREEAVSWNLAGDVWNTPNQGFPFYHPNATEVCSIFGEPSDTIKSYTVQVLDETGVKQFHNEALKVGDWKGWTNTTNRNKVETLGKQEEHLGVSILNATINMVKTEEQANASITQLRSSSELSNGPVIVNSPRSAADKTTLEHIAGADEEKDAKHGLNEPVSELDLGLSERTRKVKVSNPDIATPGRSQEVQKSRDDIKKRRGQAQEWRLKQPSSVNVSQKQSIDMIVPNDLGNKSSLKMPLQEDHSSLPSGTRLDSAPSSAIEESKQALQILPSAENAEMTKVEPALNSLKEDGSSGLDDETILGCVGFLELDDDKEKEEQNSAVNRVRVSQDVKTDITLGRGLRVIRSIRQYRRELSHRNDMEKFTSELLSIFKTLIPCKDEEMRRKQLLSSLDELVSGIWPDARLYLFGSCANAFGVRNSDIDICLSISSEISSKSDLVLRLANALRTNKMQNVQALTHARVPIVKFSDPTTGISCDVCINNMLAVVNTKLLHDYAQIDARLRQLAFMVKHWAKCRQVNETYRGTLSSYAYVLMCIHFLQQRKPPVLPCLQEMEPTYQVTVGDIKCSYYDQVERLKNFGSRNKESLGELLMSFFDYWAYRHDYSHTVISIRTGSFLSKVEKDWTRRIGNERHLICIEDPFEISHDLGRVVDKHSIRVLRDEFQRAAKILRHHDNPCVALFDQEE